MSVPPRHNSEEVRVLPVIGGGIACIGPMCTVTFDAVILKMAVLYRMTDALPVFELLSLFIHVSLKAKP